MLGQVTFVSPDDPAHTCVHQAELVAGNVDGLDARELEVPFGTSLGVSKGRDEASRSSLKK